VLGFSLAELVLVLVVLAAVGALVAAVVKAGLGR
jgi:Tfp pilus assembly protein FimT